MAALWGGFGTVHASISHVEKVEEAAAHVLATLPAVQRALKDDKTVVRHDWSVRDACPATCIHACDTR